MEESAKEPVKQRKTGQSEGLKPLHFLKTHVANQDDPGTGNLQEDDFAAIGTGLEGDKDSPLDSHAGFGSGSDPSPHPRA